MTNSDDCLHGQVPGACFFCMADVPAGVDISTVDVASLIYKKFAEAMTEELSKPCEDGRCGICDMCMDLMLHGSGHHEPLGFLDARHPPGREPSFKIDGGVYGYGVSFVRDGDTFVEVRKDYEPLPPPLEPRYETCTTCGLLPAMKNRLECLCCILKTNRDSNDDEAEAKGIGDS